MIRSRFFLPTLKEVPSEATSPSHILMLRAGYVRPLSAGIYTLLPLGWLTARKVMEIIREEMFRIGAQEFFFPALNPLDIWDETGRSKDFGEEMFRLIDRKGRPHCLAPTHEEVVCATARGNIRSWRDLPQIWFQIQTKFRDEPRPRGGMLRMRQFIMKDSYSLDRDEEGLHRSYQLHREAYQRIFQRCGLEFFIVGASSGLMGGGESEEFMTESASGEDIIARCSRCHYAANLEIATSAVEPVSGGESQSLREVSTPGKRTVEEVSQFLNLPPNRFIKTLLYMSGEGPVMALLSGEDELAEAKLSRVVGSLVRPAHPDEIREWMKAEAGFIGPHGDHPFPIYADLRLEEAKGMVSGANRNDYHMIGLEMGRDIHPDEFVDLRQVKEGEGCPVCAQPLKLVAAIELGHIFKLGTKYSQAMGLTYLNEAGQEKPVVMGSYGIGVERIIASSIERWADDAGIRWNAALTPLEVILIPLGGEENAVEKEASQIYQLLQQEGLTVLWDDREARAGVKMKDADLIGITTQVIISPRNLNQGVYEIKDRWTGERFFVPREEIAGTIRAILERHTPETDLSEERTDRVV